MKNSRTFLKGVEQILLYEKKAERYFSIPYLGNLFLYKKYGVKDYRLPTCYEKRYLSIYQEEDESIKTIAKISTPEGLLKIILNSFIEENLFEEKFVDFYKLLLEQEQLREEGFFLVVHLFRDKLLHFLSKKLSSSKNLDVINTPFDVEEVKILKLLVFLVIEKHSGFVFDALSSKGRIINYEYLRVGEKVYYMHPLCKDVDELVVAELEYIKSVFWERFLVQKESARLKVNEKHLDVLEKIWFINKPPQ